MWQNNVLAMSHPTDVPLVPMSCFRSSGIFFEQWLRTGLNFSIFRLNFPINFKIFTEFFQNFAIFSEFLNEFEYFGARSWNSDKNLSKFRWEISFLMNILWCFDWIFNIQFRKIVDDFSLKFSDWRGAKVCKSCRSRNCD